MRIDLRRRPFVVAAALSALALAAIPDRASAAPSRSRASASLRFMMGLDAATRDRLRPGWERDMPVVIRLDGTLTHELATRLEELGARLERGHAGVPLGARRVAARADAATVDALTREPGVARVSLDGAPYRVSPPLDLTRALISADAVQRTRGEDGLSIRGDGITICDIDQGVDVFNPMLFHADGGLFEWNDENDNGVLDPGIDTVDIGEGPVVIRALNGVVVDRWTGEPILGTEDEKLDLKYDYLYADENGDGARQYGAEDGFTDDKPSLGEQLFVADDVDGSGAIEVGEKIVALGTSKVKAFRVGMKVHRRGVDLATVRFKESMEHGNSVSAILVGGQPDYGTLVGAAPDADLIMAKDSDGGELTLTNFCIDEGARVVLHEYAPWVTFHLDGSSDLEQRIDETVAQGIVHVNPAGNLSGEKKSYKRLLTPGAGQDVPIEVPSLGIQDVLASFLWRDVERRLSFLVTSPGGDAVDLGDLSDDVIQWVGDYRVSARREDSDRGTARVDIDIVSPGGVVPTGEWVVSVTDPSPPSAPPIALVGFVHDEVSGWSLGAHFVSDVSEDHLIGWPGTADHGLAVAAFTAHEADHQTPGYRAWYSGRGRRIDDVPILSVSAPANPFVPTHTEGYALSYEAFGGTSGASPHVAGVAALYLQAVGAGSGDEVKHAIETHALADEATGAVPNEDYGYGKLDAHAAIFGDRAPAGSAPVVTAPPRTVEVGTVDLEVDVTDAEDAIAAIVIEVDRDYDGVFDEAVSGATFQETFAVPGDYIMKVRATDPTGRIGQALLRVHVVEPTSGQSGGDGEEESITVRGGACAIDGAAPRSVELAWLGVAAAVVATSRRATRRRGGGGRLAP